MIDFIVFSGSMEGRVCESTTHLHEFFEDPVSFEHAADGRLSYVAPKVPGFAKFLDSALSEWVWPHGTCWRDETKVGPGLGKRARDEMEAEQARAKRVLT